MTDQPTEGSSDESPDESADESTASLFDEFRPVAAQPDGMFTFDYDQGFLDTIVILAGQLSDGLGENSPNFKRLFPTAYPDDPEKDAGYQILARDQLVDARREAVEIMRRSVNSELLTFQEISAWMGICNDLRLVLGTRLEISEDDTETLPKDHPEAPTMELYRILGYVVSDIVMALLGAHNGDVELDPGDNY